LRAAAATGRWPKSYPSGEGRGVGRPVVSTGADVFEELERFYTVEISEPALFRMAERSS